MSEATLALAAAAAAAGILLGLAYFACLRRTILLFAAGRGWARPAALTLARIGIAVLVLVIAARAGAVPLLAAFAGFLVARAIALRPARSAP